MSASHLSWGTSRTPYEDEILVELQVAQSSFDINGSKGHDLYLPVREPPGAVNDLTGVTFVHVSCRWLDEGFVAGWVGSRNHV